LSFLENDIFLFSDYLLDIGGCDMQKQEIREAVELPLTHHELYKQIIIGPPQRGAALVTTIDTSLVHVLCKMLRKVLRKINWF
jgi:SpoVK/Ycf46/Vps4 family AAA+-type ATPase